MIYLTIYPKAPARNDPSNRRLIDVENVYRKVIEIFIDLDGNVVTLSMTFQFKINRFRLDIDYYFLTADMGRFTVSD